MRRLLFIVLILLGYSCNVFETTSKTRLVDNVYSMRTDSGKRKVYVDVQDDDAIRVNPLRTEGQREVIDSGGKSYFFPLELLDRNRVRASFIKPSFDLDFITIPLKYRPGNSSVPGQLNANLNGAAYLGFRTDRYRLSYHSGFTGKAERKLEHQGFSIGLFTGLGNTFMSPTNTANRIQQEYDGIIWNKGIAAIFAVNNFTVGLALGFDHLMDRNRSTWIYQGKPWYGLAFGLNLN